MRKSSTLTAVHSHGTAVHMLLAFFFFFLKPGACGFLLVQFLIAKTRGAGPWAPSPPALLYPQLPRHLFSSQDCSVILHILSANLEGLRHTCDARFFSIKVTYISPIYFFMCPLIILYYSCSKFSRCGIQTNPSDTLAN